MNTNPIIRVKRSLVQGKVPTVDQLGLGEIAINHYDAKVFIRQDTLGVGIGTTVVQIGVQGVQGTQGLSNQGVQGSVGIQGDTGSQGSTGAQGTSGIQGDVGSQGSTGAQGTLGAQGSSGAQGNVGSQGTSGSQGSTGAQGTSGIQGDTGSQGSTGAQGISGIQGDTGSQGSTGAQGISGIQGDVGSQGSTGAQGTSGIQGDTGSQGSTGAQGTSGIQGDVGSQGSTGAQGTSGIQGDVGSQGIQGTTGPVAGSANQVVYKDGSNNPTGSGNLTFDGINLYVGGNITIGGTTALIAATRLEVGDKDIVVGIATTTGGIVISNDTTANHGGIAVASTVGTPLIDINAGVGTDDLPSTYKQLMWIKAGTFAGLNTDAWISNYAVGVGTFDLANGVRFAAGGLRVTDSTITSPQLNVSGVSTFGGLVELDSSLRDFYGNVGVAGSVLISTGAGVSWTTPFAAGLQGAQGTTGSSGSQGTSGAQGTSGIQGNVGSQGTSGAQGSTGAQGTSGIQGDIGSQGSIGAQGTSGIQGDIGSQGSIGAQGTSGIQGDVGSQGTSGAQGSTGAQGTSGSQGTSGAQGSTGAQGTSGIQGNVGSQGTSGAQGSTGAQGTSGIQGSSGAQGNVGSQGSQGTQGTQGTIGSTGNTGGVPYVFSTTITDSDPGNGTIQYNSGTIGSVSFIYIDNNDANSDAQTTWYDTWDDSTNPNQKGYLIIQGSASGSTTVNVWSITGAVTVASGYYKIPVAHISGSLPTNGATLAVQFSRTGNQGSQGVSGTQGVQGASVQGISGAQGSQGTFGPVAGSNTQVIFNNNSVSAGATNFVYDATNQRVGIGTTIPLQNLHVLGNFLVAAGSSTGQHITQKAYELNSGTLSWEGSAGQLFSITNNLTSGSIFSVNDISGIPSIDVNANGTILLGPYGGNIGVGTTSPVSKLHVIGTITCNDLNSTSDFNLKDNIRTFENAIDIIQEIRGVKFKWKENQKPSVGVVAQEVEKVLPELVTDTNPKTVNYNGLIGVMIEAIKEQQDQINILKQQIEEIKNGGNLK